MTKFAWNDVNTAELKNLVGTESPVSNEVVADAAEALGTTTRSVGAKLRNLGFEVAKAGAKESKWTPEQEAELAELVQANPNSMTYAEIAAAFQGGAFNSKQVQGKLLNLELYGLVRKADKKVLPRTYSEDEEAQFVQMAKSGATIEALAAHFGKEVASIRGKALSLTRSGELDAMPKQATSTAKEAADVLAGVDVANLTVEQIAEQTGKTVRGIKSMLSRRGVDAANYKGAAKREKLDSTKE